MQSSKCRKLAAIVGWIIAPLALCAVCTQAQQVVIDSTTVQRGGEGVLAAHLDTGAALVAGAQLDLTLPLPEVTVPALPNGRANCAVNPAIHREQSFFVFQPTGCVPATPGSCTSVRVLIFDTSEISAIPDQSMLFTCVVAVAPSAPLGPQLIAVSGVVLSTPDGIKVPGASGVNGSLLIVDAAAQTPTPSRTITPTSTPTVTPTLTPTRTFTPTATASATATITAPQACLGDCDGSGEVTIDEILVLVNIALGVESPAACVAGDGNHDSEVTIDEVLTAVNHALGEC